jgi:hypothetical protein
MDIKETRGRKPKHEYKLKLRQVMTIPYTKSDQVSMVARAKRAGHKVRTWRENNILYIKRVE